MKIYGYENIKRVITELRKYRNHASRSRYNQHQGKRECARRMRQQGVAS